MASARQRGREAKIVRLDSEGCRVPHDERACLARWKVECCRWPVLNDWLADVWQRGRILSVPVGDALLGRVVDPLGRPLDGKGGIATLAVAPIERLAPGVVDRERVREPLQTGLKAIDAMIPIGRGLGDAGSRAQIITTASCRLFALVEAGVFDAALYYRLNVLLLRATATFQSGLPFGSA